MCVDFAAGMEILPFRYILVYTKYDIVFEAEYWLMRQCICMTFTMLQKNKFVCSLFKDVHVCSCYRRPHLNVAQRARHHR